MALPHYAISTSGYRSASFQSSVMGKDYQSYSRPAYILKQMPMIPDFGSCFRTDAMGLNPSPV